MKRESRRTSVDVVLLMSCHPSRNSAGTFRLVPKLPAASIISCRGSCGRFDGYLRCTQNPHNTAAGAPVIESPGCLMPKDLIFYLLISQKAHEDCGNLWRGVALFCGFSLPLEPLNDAVGELPTALHLLHRC